MRDYFGVEYLQNFVERLLLITRFEIVRAQILRALQNQTAKDRSEQMASGHTSRDKIKGRRPRGAGAKNPRKSGVFCLELEE